MDMSALESRGIQITRLIWQSCIKERITSEIMH